MKKVKKSGLFSIDIWFFWDPALHCIMIREVYVLLRDSGMVSVAFFEQGRTLKGGKKANVAVI